MASWQSQRSEPLQHPYLSCPPAEGVVLAGTNPPCTNSLPTRVGRRLPPAAAPHACCVTLGRRAGGKRPREKNKSNLLFKFALLVMQDMRCNHERFGGRVFAHACKPRDTHLILDTTLSCQARETPMGSPKWALEIQRSKN